MGNKNLRAADGNKDDEFYTGYDDIKKELVNYAKYFKGKVIYCNCDDHNGIGLGTPKSNFLKYLADNFEAFKIKKVIATHYEKGTNSSTMYILDKDNTGDGITCFEDISEIPLKGNGDFRSSECVAQLMEYNKKFLIIGNKNALSYKDVFSLIKYNKVWLGYNSPSDFTYNGEPTKKITGLTRWFTNIENRKRNEFLSTGKKYYGFEKMYPKYDNYDAINVDKVNDIPMDYFGVMGVPITFMDKYNPEQFEIIDGLNRYTILDIAQINNWAKANHIHLTEINGKSKYLRILIRRLKNDNEDISASN